MSRVYQEHSHCYDKRKNKINEVRKMYLFLLPPLSSQEVLVVAAPSPHPQLFSQQNFMNFFFSLIHGYLGKGWANRPNENHSRKAKTTQGKIRKREVRCDNRQPLLRGLKKLCRLRILYTSQVRSKIIMFTFRSFQH